MGTIKGSDFASAIVGDKVNEKAIIKFAKSNDANFFVDPSSKKADYKTEVVQYADKLYRVEINFGSNPKKTLNDVWEKKEDAVLFAKRLADKNNGTYEGSSDWNKSSNKLKDASYISNRDIVSLTIKKGSDTITINGNDILDGVYLKNNTTMSAPKESASDIVLKIITKAKELDKKVPFWGNLKEKMTIVTAPRVQKLLDAGYDTKEIMLIYLGIYSVFDVTIDGEVAYNKVSGLFDYETSYVDEQIDNYIGISKSNEYELGLKYPELDWSKIIEKYKISKKPKIINGEKRKFGNTLRMDVYAIYQGEDVVVSTNIDVEVTENGVKQPKSSFNSKKAVTDGKFNNGYWGITSSKKEIIMDILSMIVTQDSSSYVKDINVFFNGLGGAHAETLIENKIKFEQGGNIGRTISFMDWKGNVRKGVITEKLKRGYEVLTSDGVALVEDSEIIE